MKGLFPRRLSSIPANRLSFEKCRVIVRNLPFTVRLEMVYEYR